MVCLQTPALTFERQMDVCAACAAVANHAAISQMHGHMGVFDDGIWDA